MDYPNKNIDPWDDGVFGTGKTEPPKNHSGIIALLLILVIFLSGIVSVLSFLNIQLFQQLNAQKKEKPNTAPVSLSGLSGHTHPTEEGGLENRLNTADISLHLSPQSVENIPQEGTLSWQDIYEQNLPSVVGVVSSGSTGTGVILSENGYIITNYQTVYDAETITVQFSDGRELSAVVVGADSVTDLAVLYVSTEGLIPAQFGDSTPLRVGDPVASLGIQLTGALTPGIIAAINRDMPFMGQNITLIQSSLPLASGQSGGPLLNRYGQVVGIHTACLEDDRLQRVSFAIPSATVKEIVDQLIAQGYVSGRPTLGIRGDSVTRFDQNYFHVPAGLYISHVDPESDAHSLGIQPGDILISLNGIPVPDQKTLDTLVNALKIGDTAAVLFYRDGHEEACVLTVGEYDG